MDDIRWCRYLNNPHNKYSLLKTTEIKDGNMIVCQQLKYRQFARFDNHSQFMKYQSMTEPYENCFYEIMVENTNRKPYFDIDISRKNNENKEYGNQVIEQIKKNILEVLEENKADLNKVQILVYTSHTSKKLSYHIVVHGYYLKNHFECKNFFETVSGKCDYYYQNYMDCSVYKIVQQLRIIGSHKFRGKNTKVLSKSLSYNFKIPERYLLFPGGERSYILLTSLVSNTVDCEHLSGFEYDEQEIDYGRFIYLPETDAQRLDFGEKISTKDSVVKIKLPGKAGAADDADLDQVLEIFYSKYPKEAFKFNRTIMNDGNLIITFLRRRKTFCNVCQRDHNNENPYIRVSGMNRDIYFHCRRDKDDRGELFGSLGKIELKDVKVDDILQGAPAKDILAMYEDVEGDLLKIEEELVEEKREEEEKGGGDLSRPLKFLRL